MNTIRVRTGTIVLCIIGLLLMMTGCGRGYTVGSGELHITVLDIEKSDAILIQGEEQVMLIDTGLDQYGQTIVDLLKERGIETIDYLVITHFDKDHVGGADIILKQMQVNNVIQPDYEKDSRQYYEYYEAVMDQHLEPLMLKQAVTFNLDDAAITIYPSNIESAEDDNDVSLVTSIQHHENLLFFAADVQTERIHELLEWEGLDLDHDFLKVPHHGLMCEDLDLLFEAVHPKYAVVTNGAEMEMDQKVRDLLDMVGAVTWETDGSGHLTWISDGHTLNFKEG